MNRLFSLLIVLTLSTALKTPASAHDYPAVDPFITTEKAQRLKAMRKISPAAMHSIEPVIRDWLQFYHLDISKFYLGKKGSWLFYQDYPSYARDFDAKNDDVYIPQKYDYSPSKQKYLDYKLIDKLGNQYVFAGHEDSEELYLVDRKQKTKKIIQWFGSAQMTEATFWLDEEHFIIVGLVLPNSYFIYTLGPKNQLVTYYYESTPEQFKTGYETRFLQAKGVIIPKD